MSVGFVSPHSLQFVFLNLVSLIVAAECGFLKQKNLRKSMNSMLDCFLEINHVTPFGFISVQAPVNSQVSNK